MCYMNILAHLSQYDGINKEQKNNINDTVQCNIEKYIATSEYQNSIYIMRKATLNINMLVQKFDLYSKCLHLQTALIYY